MKVRELQAILEKRDPEDEVQVSNFHSERGYFGAAVTTKPKVVVIYPNRNAWKGT